MVNIASSNTLPCPGPCPSCHPFINPHPHSYTEMPMAMAANARQGRASVDCCTPPELAVCPCNRLGVQTAAQQQSGKSLLATIKRHLLAVSVAVAVAVGSSRVPILLCCSMQMNGLFGMGLPWPMCACSPDAITM